MPYFFYFLLRVIFVLMGYFIASDLSKQMQIAENIVNGLGFVRAMDNYDGTVYYYADWQFPPALSYVLAFFRLFIQNIIFADIAVKIMLVFFETMLFRKIVDMLDWSQQREKQLYLLGCSLVFSHLYDAFTADQMAFVVFLGLFVASWQFMQTKKTKYLIYAAFCTIILPVVKYSFIPMIFCLPFYYVWTNRMSLRHLFASRHSYILAGALLVSLSFFYYMTSQAAELLYGKFDIHRIQYFSRIDHFWYKLGNPIDRIYKALSRRSSSWFGFFMEPRNIGQIVSLLFFFLLFILARKRKIQRNDHFQNLLLIATMLQVIFLMYNTLASDVQYGDWGIDKKIWVSIEETRYYLHLKYLFLIGLLYFLLKNGFRWLYYPIVSLLLFGYVLMIYENRAKDLFKYREMQRKIVKGISIEDYGNKYAKSMKTIYYKETIQIGEHFSNW